MQLLKNRPIAIWAFTGSLTLGAIGIWFLLGIMEYVRIHINMEVPAYVGFFTVFAGLSVFITAMLTYQVERACGISRYKGLGSYLSRMALFLPAAAGFYLVFGLLNGVFAVFLYELLKNSWSFEVIKWTIHLLSQILSVLITPIILMQFLTFSLYNARFWRTLRMGFITLRFCYLKLLAVTASCGILGWIIRQMADLFSADWAQKVWMCLFYSILGTLAAALLFQIGLTVYKKRR